MRGEITIAAPGTAQAPYPPPLAMGDWAGGVEGYSRSPDPEAWVQMTGKSIWGTPQLSGPAYDPTYLWQFQFHYSEAIARQLIAFALWQNREYQAGRDGHLLLTDEMLYLPSEPPPHSRTLLATLNESWPSPTPWVYGFGVFKVKLVIAENPRQIVGSDPGGPVELLLFGAVEV